MINIFTTLYVFIICIISLCLGDSSNINENPGAAQISSTGGVVGIANEQLNTLSESIANAAKGRRNNETLLAATESSQGITPRTQCPYAYTSSEEGECEESQECSNCDKLGATLALLENSDYGIVLNDFKQLINVLIFSLTANDRPLGMGNAEIAIQSGINFNYSSIVGQILSNHHDEITIRVTGFRGIYDNDLNDFLEKQVNTNGKMKLVILGTPTNPCSECVDIIEICKKIKKNKDIIVVFDNTQQTAPIHRPQEHCADIIINSGEILFGLGSELDCNKNPPLASIVTRNKQYYDYFVDYQKKNGLIISDSQRCCSSSHRLSTLNIRVKQQCSNAVVIATLLESAEIIEQVNYPGLACHSHHEICAKTMKCGGPTITFKIKEDSNGNKTTKFIECINESNVFNIKGNTVNYNNFIGGINTYFTKHNDRCGNNADDRTPWIRVYTGIEDIYDIATATKLCLNQIDGSYIRRINPDATQ